MKSRSQVLRAAATILVLVAPTACGCTGSGFLDKSAA